MAVIAKDVGAATVRWMSQCLRLCFLRSGDCLT
jgi:hypothetical protein